jgi:Tol biopolymer transport system component/tRNA A-37 threonylcarbamoyl transferase component Bud32
MTEGHTARLESALADRYRIERELGEGGMATVYLADDLKHDRKVALKVLKPELAAVIGAERFLTEIRVTAGLRHPNILPLFDSGEADSFLFYVMPYVEGESLRDRLDREHQVPVADAVRIAISVANALEHAHRKGVVHRDIKPANIMLQDGEPMVADFGVALAVNSGEGRLTETGLSVGTPYYMSPEQATGDRSVGPTSDLYSLACVLYEMLAGQPPHAGGSAQAVLARIISGDADPVRTHRPTTPPNVEAALHKALERIPSDRFESAEEFAGALGDPGFRYGIEPGAVALPSRGLRLVTAGALAVALAATAVAIGALTRAGEKARPARILTQELTLVVGERRLPAQRAAVSPDGRKIVYLVSDARGVRSLYTRYVDAATAEPIPGTEGARYLAIAPSNDEVAFTPIGLGPLTVASLDGGGVRVLAERAQSEPVWGDRHVYFLDAELGISRVPVEGGPVERMTPVSDDDLVRAPSDVLPGGEVVLFSEFRRGETQGVVRALSVDSGEMVTLTAGLGGVVREGFLIYGDSEGRIVGIPFDADALTVSGEEVTLLSGLRQGGALIGASVFRLSRSGDLIYAPAGMFFGTTTQPVWVARTGDVTRIPTDWRLSPVQSVSSLALSHDGYYLAASSGRDLGQVDLFVHDLRGGPIQRLSLDALVSTRPFWSPDDRDIYYFVAPAGAYLQGDLMARRADGSGASRRILSGVGIGSGAWGRDGDWMIYRVGVPAHPSRDIFALRAGASEPIELVATEAVEQAPSLSPDGRWLLYQSDRSGQHEVYVCPFPEVDDGLQQISLDGGTEPRWAHSGREIFYRDAQGGMVAVAVESGPTELRVSGREVLFDASPFWSDPASQQYDVAPDDRRFLMLQRQAEGNQMIVIWNWFERAKAMIEEGNR